MPRRLVVINVNHLIQIGSNWLCSSPQAETRAEFAERSVAKLEKTIDDLEGMNLFHLIFRYWKEVFSDNAGVCVCYISRQLVLNSQHKKQLLFDLIDSL